MQTLMHKSGCKVELPFERFRLSAKARGKEMTVTFSNADGGDNSVSLLMQMGMSGFWAW